MGVSVGIGVSVLVGTGVAVGGIGVIVKVGKGVRVGRGVERWATGVLVTQARVAATNKQGTTSRCTFR